MNLQRTSKIARLCLLLVAVFAISACSNKKSTWVTRTFHNTTSRFNAYYYARISLNETKDKLIVQHKEDYTKFIPIFVYPTPEEAKGLFAEMDKNIKRLSRDIHYHTITKSKKEIPGACKWIDHCYVLMGKSHFYKRDFFAALESFDYVSRTYKKSPSRFIGMMWMIRTYDEMGSVEEAAALIDLLSAEKSFPDEYKAEFAAIEATHFIEIGNYQGAILPLEKCIALSKSNKYFLRYFLDYGKPLEDQMTHRYSELLRGRCLFLEAQIEERLNKPKKAAALYGDVIALNPTDELTFNAQMNRVNCYDPASPLAEDMKRELLRMAKDRHYGDRLDQIYYALSIMAQKENNIPQCLAYLNLSVRKSQLNKLQKARSYLKMADIHYDQTEYKPAQSYYDSTIGLVKPDFPNYEFINTKKKTLTDLVRYLNTISREDSLQALAKLSDAERNARIEKVIADEDIAEQKAEEIRQANFLQAQNVTNVMGGNAAQSAGGANAPNNGQWYFWNSNTIASGVKDFQKRFGDRKLEDNWRRSVKEIVIEDPSTAANPSQAAEAAADSIAKKVAAAKAKSKKNPKVYLANIPLTPEAIAKSNDKIIDAYYNLGSIYREKLDNNQRAADAFETLLNRYPENKFTVITYYQLYRLYIAMNKPAKADVNKNVILSRYPETEYAKIIKDPGYNSNKQSSLSEAEKVYAQVYQLYRDSNYIGVLEKCKEADTTLGKSPLLSRFDLLKALAIGHTQGVDEFEVALTRIVIKYPKEPVRDKAQEYLDHIKRLKSGNKAVLKKDTTTPPTPYVYAKDANFYWVLYYDGPLDANKYKGLVASVNDEFYSNDNLTVESLMLDANHAMIIVKSFQGNEKAMTYHGILTNDKKSIYESLHPDKLKTFVISSDNFPLFYKAKNITEYLKFFETNMLPAKPN